MAAAYMGTKELRGESDRSKAAETQPASGRVPAESFTCADSPRPSCRCHICHSLGIDLGNRVERRGKGSFARTGPNGLTLFTLRPIDHTRDPLDRELWLPREEYGCTCQRAKRKERESRIPLKGKRGNPSSCWARGAP